MKRYKFLAAIALVVLTMGSLAVAQEGYYGQQATTKQPAQQADSGARLVACACGHMHGDMTAAMRAYAPPAETSKDKQMKHKHEMNNGTSAGQPQGDPSAVQNQVEYGGGA